MEEILLRSFGAFKSRGDPYFLFGKWDLPRMRHISDTFMLLKDRTVRRGEKQQYHRKERAGEKMAGATVNRTLIACAKDEYRVDTPEKTRNSRVLILGGTGRVGGSTAIALSKLCPELRVIVGGRNRERGAAMVTTLGGNSEFVEVNIDNVKSLEAALNDVDLVVNTAGPFQRAERCTVLEAAIDTKLCMACKIASQ